MPRNRSVALVVYNNALLVMFRKNTEEYYTFPGGGVEAGETSEQAVVREIMEETSIEVEVERLVYTIMHDTGDEHFFFLCRYVAGSPALQPGTNEYLDTMSGTDTYLPQWLPLEQLTTTTLYPLVIRDQLVHDLSHGFSKEVTHFTLKAVK